MVTLAFIIVPMNHPSGEGGELATGIHGQELELGRAPLAGVPNPASGIALNRLRECGGDEYNNHHGAAPTGSQGTNPHHVLVPRMLVIVVQSSTSARSPTRHAAGNETFTELPASTRPT